MSVVAGNTVTTVDVIQFVGGDVLVGSEAGKVGFHGTAPTAQGAAIANASDAATVITQLNLVLAELRAKGLIAV